MAKCTALLIMSLLMSGAASAADGATPATTISGQAVDQAGKPVSGAQLDVTVSWEDKTASSGWAGKNEKVTTDKQGRFTTSLSYGPGRSYASVAANAEGYCVTRYGQSSEQGSVMTIKLTPCWTLKAKVVDEKGKPVTNARVRMDDCYGYGGNASVNINRSADDKGVVTGKNGWFALGGIPRPNDFQYLQLTLKTEAPGRALVRMHLDKSELTKLTKIVDPLECKIEGTLYLPGKTGPAPEKTQVMFEVPYNRGAEGRYATVGADGEFSISQLPPGKVNVVLDTSYSRDRSKPRDWALPAVMGVELSPKRTTKLDLVMVPGALVSGKIIDKATGKGIPRAQLSVTHPGRPSFPDSAATDENGDFSIRVVPGDVNIIVEYVERDRQYVHFDYESRPTMSLKVAEGQDKSDVAFKIDLNQANDQSIYNVQSTPIPPDFELIPGTYQLAWDSEFDCTGPSLGNPYWGTNEGIDASKLPKLVSARAKRFWFEFDGKENEGKLLAVLDESGGTEKGWDTIYLDTNRNGDLTDEQPISLAKASYRSRTDWVTVNAHQGPAGGVRTDHPLQIRVTLNSPTSSNPYIQLSRKGCWKGLIDTNKGKVECAAVDSNGNGVSGDRVAVKGGLQYEAGGDYIFINTNGYSQLAALSYGPHCITLNKVTKVGGKFYDISVSPVGDKITVAPYEGGMGDLLVTGKSIQGVNGRIQSLYVTGEPGVYSLDDCKGQSVSLPSGRYRITSASVALNTSNKMSLRCSSELPVTIEAGKQAVIPIAGRLSMALESGKQALTFAPGSSQSINWDMKIGTGITVSAISDASNSGVPKVLFIKDGDILGETTANPG